ncbi:MAG TPA: replication protein RepA, partial [Blastocatellia bacterium]
MAEAAALIHSQLGPGKDELAFLAKHLVQVTLPHSDPGNVELWSRTNGNFTLSIVRVQRDPNTNRLIGYPYGTIPRLLLYWMTSEAVRTGSRTIKLGSTLSQFMKEVGLNPETGGGKRGDAVRLREQMARLFAASISFQYAEDGQGTSWLNMPVTRRAQLWWNPKNLHQGNLFESWIELGEDFFEAITSSPVPLDTRALKALNHSALALDLYAWTTYKAHVLTVKRDSQFVSYADLQTQLGSEYNDIKNFKKKLHVALKQVRVIYP